MTKLIKRLNQKSFFSFDRSLILRYILLEGEKNEIMPKNN